MIECRNLTVGHNVNPVLSSIDLSIPQNGITAMVGANGCGKSTLLKTLAGLLPPLSGDVFLDGQRLDRMPRRQIASRIAVLSQFPQAPEGLTVAQLVEHGRFARRGFFERGNSTEVMAALEQTGIAHKAHHPFHRLSGGERQRVWISLALAQRPQMLLLDEPTSYLDMGCQIEVLELLRSLCAEGIGIILVLHDINQASHYANRIIALKDGGIFADGNPQTVVTPQTILDLFRARVQLVEGRCKSRPYVIAEGHS